MLQHRGTGAVQRPALVCVVAQGQGAVTTQVHVPDLDVGLAPAKVVLLGQLPTQCAVAAFVVDGPDLQFAAGVVVKH